MPTESEKTETTGAATRENGASLNPLATDPELLNDFILESREHLTSIELQLLTLDQDPANAEAIHAIFRGFHTIKGMAGFLDLDAVRDVAHEVETVLDLARNGQLAITPVVIDRILESKDYLSRCMTELEAMHAERNAGGAGGQWGLAQCHPRIERAGRVAVRRTALNRPPRLPQPARPGRRRRWARSQHPQNQWSFPQRDWWNWRAR